MRCLLNKENFSDTETDDYVNPFADLAGIFSGKMKMSEDFNEPMEEFKEYM
jgi:hypothetical protein